MYDSVTLMYNESLQQKNKNPSCGKLQGDTRRQRRWKLCPSAALTMRSWYAPLAPPTLDPPPPLPLTPGKDFL
jgi:hypothetical protein